MARCITDLAIRMISKGKVGSNSPDMREVRVSIPGHGSPVYYNGAQNGTPVRPMMAVDKELM